MLNALLASPATPPPDWLRLLVMVVGVVTLGVLLTMSMRRRVDQRNAMIPEPRERIERIKANREQHDQATRATVELLDTSRRLAAQLDVRAERLEQLIAEADAKTEALRATLERQREAAASAPPPRRPAAASPTRRVPAGADISPPPLDPLTTTVYDLSDRGHDAAAIARELNEHIGKVELILALRER